MPRASIVATTPDDDEHEHEHDEDPPERAMAGSHEDRMRAGGFTIVSKRRGRGPPTRPPREEGLVTANGSRANLVGNARAAPSGDSSAADDEILDQRLDAAVAELRAAVFAQQLIAYVRSVSVGAPAIDSLLCLGVGHFASSRAARYQFALMLLLRDELRQRAAFDSSANGSAHASAAFDSYANGSAHASASGEPLPLMVYDPVMVEAEVRCVRRRGGSVPAHNDEGRVRIEGRRCLCYLPHCTRQLYANLLAANWGAHQLSRVVVIGIPLMIASDCL
jgi:hypothetical protein